MEVSQFYLSIYRHFFFFFSFFFSSYLKFFFSLKDKNENGFQKLFLDNNQLLLFYLI